MKLPIGVAAILCAFPILVQGAPGLTVDYLDGQAYVQSGGAWKDLTIGASIENDATVRLDKSAYMLLKTPAADIILTQEGTYSIRSLLTMQQSLRSAGVGKAFVSFFTYILSGGVKNQSSVLGARGADKGKSDEPGWEESGAQVFLDTGKTFLQSGQYEKAIEQFQQALASAGDGDRPAIQYYLASTYSLEGKTHDALIQAARIGSASGEEWYADYVILKARLLTEANSFEEEVRWLTANGKDLSQDLVRAPMYYFLLGLG
jgi:tetratricopeptide (TPR) repeat protein